MKSEYLLVPRGGFEIRSKILGCEDLLQSAALILSGSFVSATLSNINIFAITVQRRNHAHLRGFDVDLAAVAEEPDVYELVQTKDS